MFDFYNLNYTAIVFLVSIIITLVNVVIQIGKYFCVEPFYSFSKSKFYNHTDTIVFMMISLFCTLICTFGILISDKDFYNYGSFIATVLLVFYLILQLGTAIVKVLKFMKNYHRKLYNKRFGEKND